MPSSLPSSFSRPKPEADKPYSPPQASQPSLSSEGAKSGGGNLVLVVAALALALSLASVYGTFFMDRPLSPAQKQALMGIANDLRSLQDRSIEMTAPVSTTIDLNKSYPIKDLFPAQFGIPLSFNIPIDTELVGLGATGQPVRFRVQEEVPISANVTINSASAFGANTIQIKKTLPVEARFTSSIKIRAAYGQELNKMIDKIESVANGGAG